MSKKQRKLKIAINATYNPSGGSRTQLINMIKNFTMMDDIDIVVFIRKRNIDLIKNIKSQNCKIIISRFAGVSRFTRILWEQTILPFLIRNKVDVLFCPGNIAPIFSPVKSVVWIGTIGPFIKSFLKYFFLQEKFELYINKFIMIASARSATAVIFESRFTEKLFIESYRIKPTKSHVINIGKDVCFKIVSSEIDKELHNDYGNYEPFALCVSHLYPYKNIIRMLKAIKKSIDETGVKINLLIAGSRISKSYDNRINKCIEKLCIQKNVTLLGAISKESLQYLYSNCEFLIFPSPFENFAYTLVEAMSCGTPIICSNTTAMPETCKDAAIYFDPYDTEEMSEQISQFLNNEKLRNTYREKSIARANELPDFEDVTLQTLDIIKNLVNE